MILSYFNRGLICYCRVHGAIGEEEFGVLLVVEERNDAKAKAAGKTDVPNL